MRNKIFLSIVIAFGALMSGTLASDYEEGKCYCIDELDSFLGEKLPIEPKPTAPIQNYTGVRVVSANKFSTCVCDDVSRIATPFVFTNETAYEASKSFVGQTNMTKLIKETLEFYNTNSDVLVYCEVKFNSTDEENNTIFHLEFYLKGHPEEIPTFVTTMLEETVKNISVEYATVDNDKLDVKALECSDSPLAADLNGMRNMTTSFPGARAFYSCNENYVLKDPESAFSVCSHETLEWVPPKESIECLKGCTVNPAKPPLYSVMEWDPVMRKEGDKAVYTCMDGFKPKNPNLPNTTSICTDNQWTSYSRAFECEQILCPKQIPPNIDHGVVTGFEADKPHYIGNRIYYSCIEHFCSTFDDPIPVTCLKNGSWSQLPSEYQCHVKTTSFCMTFAQRRSLEAQRHEYESVYLTENLFFIVTVPGIIGLGVLLLCALALVHANSPLYRCCNENKRQRYASKGRGSKLLI